MTGGVVGVEGEVGFGVVVNVLADAGDHRHILIGDVLQHFVEVVFVVVVVAADGFFDVRFKADDGDDLALGEQAQFVEQVDV